MSAKLKDKLLLVGLFMFWAVRVTAGEPSPSAAETEFQRGYYLQSHDHDAAGAAAAFEKVANDAAAPQALRTEAAARLGQVREDVALTSFAALMPPDVMGYAEIDHPGEHIENILQMVGLVANPATEKAAADANAPGAHAPPAEPPVALGGGMVLPADFTISPALIAELKKLRGAAIGLTAIDDRGKPSGLAVLHPGDCDLVRGLIETAVQLLEPGEPIDGFKTYRIPDYGWLMLTHRLVVASESREQLAAALGRLKNPQADSLAKRAEFARVYQEIGQPCVFAYVDGPQVVKRFGSLVRGQEGAMIRTLLDLEHFESAAVALGTTDKAIQLRAEVNLMPGHRNMAYALIRTAPISKRSLRMVPKGAAGVILIGLNPPAPAAAADAGPADKAQQPPMISAMDIGRELFHNIDELAVFALPAAADSAAGFPDVAAAIAVKDPEKSLALWNQILTIASLFGARTATPPADVTVEGQGGKSYQFAGWPPIVVVPADRGLVIGTQAAVAASLRAAANNESIETDPAFAGLLAHVTPDTSKALLVDVGRALELAAVLSGGSDAREFALAGKMTRDLKVFVVTDEAPNRLVIRAEVSGLPKYRDVLPLIREHTAPRRLSSAK
ncbi:MAG: hypothetical protein AB7O59_22030 [Pirellulales bacterium]